MRTYVGKVGSRPFGQVVYVLDDEGRTRRLELHLSVRNHSPTGFAWGYGGSGPAQLALAMCIDALAGDAEHARAVYQDFKWRVVAKLDPDRPWQMSQSEALDHIREIETGRKAAT